MNSVVSIVLVLLATHLCICNAGNDVVTENLKLFVDGKEFFIKAMCYNPAPLGQGVINRNGTKGAGLCSPKVTPFGTVETACYDSDYFDGGGNALDKESPPQGGWWQAAWQRDFPIIKSLGVNTLRLYNANPTTRQASIYFPEVVQLPLGKDHVPFMDTAQQFGFKVVFPLISDYGMLTGYSEGAFKRLLRWQIDELGNHPALLMWGFGNELPLDGNAGLVALMNRYITYIKQYTFTKWGRRVPVTTAVVDLPLSYNYLAATLDVDVFTTNAGYRGFTFTDLWSGNAQTQGWFELSCRYNKPLFIGEINWHSLDNAITYQYPNWFNQIWKDLVDHMDQGCIGGAFFEYSDEKLKEDPLQQTMGVVKFGVNNAGPLPSTDLNSWTPDIAVQKDIIFAAVQSGSVNGKFYNLNSSPFYLNGRAQATLGASSPICDAFRLTTCPGQNTCSFKGRCDRATGTCACNAGWTGADCSIATCLNACSGKGTCVGAVSPPVCSCQTGWSGADCSVSATAASCARDCVDGNGRCDTTTGKCVCFRGWWGHNCAIPDVSYPPTSTSPTSLPTQQPATQTPTAKPATQAPTQAATPKPATQAPTQPATQAPTQAPTQPATQAPTQPSSQGTQAPTLPPTSAPTQKATSTPSQAPTTKATTQPTAQPTTKATMQPTAQPTKQATTQPTAQPTAPSSGACGALQSCSGSCYKTSEYTCFDGLLCPLGTQRCGGACYNTNLYTCPNGQLLPK